MRPPKKRFPFCWPAATAAVGKGDIGPGRPPSKPSESMVSTEGTAGRSKHARRAGGRHASTSSDALPFDRADVAVDVGEAAGEVGDGRCDGSGGEGFDAVIPCHVAGAGEALRAARDLPIGTRLLRVAPLAAVPYAAELDGLCGGCLQPCSEDVDGFECERCSVARLCRRCKSGAAMWHHANECHALKALRDGEEGLTLAHNDLRLLLRLLSVRRRWFADAAAADSEDDVADDEGRGDPAVEAAAAAGDVIVDDFEAFAELMSGLEGGDDGELPEAAVATLHEVAKQAKYLVAAELRASVDEYVACLGRLQLNGFEMTAATASADPEPGSDSAGGAVEDPGGRGTTPGGHRPIGIGVFPSAARFNHSCSPNAHQSFDEHGCVTVDTVRLVRKGEELTIPYVDTRLPREERRAKLRKNFAFECACARCVEEDAEKGAPGGRRKGAKVARRA